MAKNIGIIKFTGKLGGLSGRDTAFGNVIQTPGGFKSDRVKHDAVYEKTRQLYTEFGRCALISSLFRQQLLPYLKLLPDPYVYNHIQKRMLAIKECDADSPKGRKAVGKGLLTPKGAALFNNFSFNQKRQFYFTGMQYHFNPDQGTLLLEGVDASKFPFPRGKNVPGIQLLLLRLSADPSGSGMHCSAVSFIQKSETAASLVLQAEMPKGDGLLVAVFFAGYGNQGAEPLWTVSEKNVLQVIWWGGDPAALDGIAPFKKAKLLSRLLRRIQSRFFSFLETWGSKTWGLF